MIMEITWGCFIVFGQLTRDGVFRYIRRELVWDKEKEEVEEGLKRNGEPDVCKNIINLVPMHPPPV